MKKEMQIEILAVGTKLSPQSAGQHSLVALAEQHGIPVLSSLDEMPEADYIVSVQHHEILKQAHIDKAKKIAVNLHMAPLPEYRGCNQFSYAILDQKTEFGTTIHTMDARIDHGDILFEKRFPIPPNCWVSDLHQLCVDASFALFKSSIPDLLTGNYHPIPQSDLIEHRGSALHYRHEINQMKVIDLSWNQDKIMQHIRATYMPGFEPPYTMIDGRKIYFSETWE
jgi:methionyl-tRNA formyltransferase